MKKIINMSFENCRIDGDDLIEDLKDGPLYHSIRSIAEMLNGEDGLSISIKKSTKSGEIRGISSGE